MILTKDKNNLLTTIQESGIDPNLFTTKDKVINRINYFTIVLRDSPIKFTIKLNDKYDNYSHYSSQFLVDFPTSKEKSDNNIYEVLTAFEVWLNNVVKPYLDNISTPDLWQIFEETRSNAKNESGMPQDFEQFSAEEKIQIKLSLNDFKLLIVKNFKPAKEELALVDARLKYLSDALDKHNKFDWKGIAISTVISITIALSLSPEQGNQLFHLFKQVFSNILYLLG